MPMIVATKAKQMRTNRAVPTSIIACNIKITSPRLYTLSMTYYIINKYHSSIFWIVDKGEEEDQAYDC